MYSSLCNDSGGFEDILDSLCSKDDTYNACTDDSDRLEQRDEIKIDVLSHLRDGLERCGQDRSEILQGTNGSAVDDQVSECYEQIDEIGAAVDPDGVDIEPMLDEIGTSVEELEALLSPSSWFGDWKNHKYTIGAFADCLGQLRVLQERDLAAMKRRVEREIANLKTHLEQKVAGSYPEARDGTGGEREASRDSTADTPALSRDETALNTESAEAQLNRSRRELLDLTLRNSLLNFRPSKTRGLKIVDEIPSEIFRILVQERRAMSFRPTGRDSEAASTGDDQELPEEWSSLIGIDDPQQAADQHVDTWLQTPYERTNLEVRLRNTQRFAHTSIEEQGVNILYLVLGMLQWFESDSSDERRTAPLILIPTALTRTDARARFKVRYADDEIAANLSLAEKFRQDFRIQLPDLTDAEDIKVDHYFRQVEKAVASQGRWSVESSAIHLGFFSFNKLLIYKDLDPTSWPEDQAPFDHPIIRALFGAQGCDDPEAPIGDDDNLDDHLDVSDVHHVVDSDSSQTLAVLDVKAGRNLVVQGPPGTGKSQTITNLLAEVIADDKKVLFVAEKMAALEVVKRRLDDIQIGDACLELHSHKASKRAVLDELRRTVELGRPVLSESTEDRRLLAADRKRLNDYSRAVNAKIGNSGLSPHHIFGRLAQLREAGAIDWPRLEIQEAMSWRYSDFVERRDRVEALRKLVKATGPANQHLFWLSGRRLPLATDRSEIVRSLTDAADVVGPIQMAADDLARYIQSDEVKPDSTTALDTLVRSVTRAADAPDLGMADHRHPEWRTRAEAFRAAVGATQALANLRANYDALLRPDAWDADVQPYREPVRAWGRRSWRIVAASYRAARQELRDMCKEDLPADGIAQLDIVDAILEAQRLRKAIEESGLLLRIRPDSMPNCDATHWQTLGDTASWLLNFHAEESTGAFVDTVHDLLERDFDRAELMKHCDRCRSGLEALAAVLDAVTERLQVRPERYPVGAGLSERCFSDLEAWLRRAQEDIDSLEEIVRFNQHESHLIDDGLGAVVELASRWNGAGEHLTRLFEYAWLSALTTQTLRDEPLLGEFDGDTHHGFIDRFRRLDLALFQNNRARVALSHWGRLPRGPGGGQLGVLRREFEKKRRHLPLRKLMAAAGNAIVQIKPLFMMSPLSIAKFIPPGSIRFDLVIFDEASQVRPVDALGAIIRAGQTVVVGDSKQLPPTSFFDRLGDDDPDEEESTATADLESILGMFLAVGAPVRMLHWHYRSHHESLIAVSNHEFYDNRLVLFPSPDAQRKEVGLRFRFDPNTCYERGNRKRFNAGEARAVADAVMAHARTSPDLTLGVAAFGISQARRIEDEVEIRRRRDPFTESFFVTHPEEPFFVKNLENVQGDERDVMLISVGYGRIEGGYIPMTFGPLNQDGGERRLNVLITRARRRLEVYTNFTADDLDTKRSDARGVQALKTFLQYAETGSLDIPKPSGAEADSPFEDAVADALRDRGHAVDHQIGSAGFFVDLGVVDPRQPGRYLLGIECDGATYHSARSARDRDRLRQQVLEARGWTIYRIWSTDWFRHPGRELERLDDAIARAALTETPVDPPAPPSDTQLQRDEGSEPPPTESDQRGQTYEMATLNAQLDLLGFHTAADNVVREWMLEVVRVESPVHVEETAARIADAAGYQRAGKRIRARVRNVARRLSKDGRLRMTEDFLWRIDHERMEFFRRRDDHLPSRLRTPDMIAPEEIGAALRHAVRISFGIAANDAITQASRLLGFKRVGSDIQATFAKVLDRLIKDGVVEERGDQLRVGPAKGGDSSAYRSG